MGTHAVGNEIPQAPFPAMTIETGHVWGPLDLVGGLPCLDFANTAGGHTKLREVERIPTYRDVINWASYAEILSPVEARGLIAALKANPKEAARRVRELLEFREALHRLVGAMANGHESEPNDFARVRTAMTKAVSVAQLSRRPSAFAWTADSEALGLGTVLTRIALSAHDMFARENPAQLRQCEICTWLFIDRTKNQKRRFCRQDACGNKSRAARFYRKKRAG